MTQRALRLSCRAPAAAAAALLAWSAPGLAQDTTDTGTIKMDAVQVSGDWLGQASEEEVRTYPGARTVLSEEKLHKTGARSIEDALKQVPGVRVEDETGTGVLPNIGIRGLNPLRSERIMIMQDGMPLALAPYTGAGLSLFPATLETIERIDVVRGGAAVHYGPNNVGGVVNLISRPIPREIGGAVKQKVLVTGENGNTLSNTYARLGGYVTPNSGLQGQVNVIGGQSFRDHSDTEVANLILDGEHLIGDDAQITARLHYYTVEADLPGALTPAQYEQDRTQSQRPHDTFDADTLRGSLNYTQFIGSDQEFNWFTYAYTADREFTFGFPFTPGADPDSIRSSPRKFFVAATEPRYSWRFGTGGVSHHLTVGGRYVRENVDYAVDSFDTATQTSSRLRDWEFETDAFAAYVSDTLGFMNDRLQVTPGLRYEFVDTDFSDRINDTDSSNVNRELLPGLTVGFQATDAVYLFANANRSLRVPQIAQVTRSGVVGSELAWNYEVGARVAPTRAVDIGATLYRIDFSDQIEFDRPSLTFQNLGKTRHQGVELAVGWRPEFAPGLSFDASYAYNDTEQLAGAFEGNEVPFASEHQLSLTTAYAVDTWDFAVTGTYRSKAFSDAANTDVETVDGSAGPLPAYWVWNAQVTKDVEAYGHAFEVAFAVNNLFDEDYYFRGVDVSPTGRVAQPGRTFMLSVGSTF